MTKILAVGDIEGDTGLVKKLVKKAEKEKVDLVILAGDITMGEQASKDLIGPFKKINKEVILLHGNWDSPELTQFLADKYSPGTKNINGYSIKKGDLGIFGAGGAEGPGPGATTDKEIEKGLKKAHEGVKGLKKKLMITHMHPANSKSEFSGVPGAKSITNAIKKFKPDVLLHGHIHEGGGIEEKIGKTKVINVARKPKIFEI